MNKPSPMKIFHIVPDISYEANGVTPVINGLSSFSSSKGHEVSVCALNAKLHDPSINFIQAKKSKYLDFNEYSPDFSKYLKIAFDECDIVHGHSLWSSANFSTGLHAKNRKAKFVTSPHGTLTDYALSRKRLIKRSLWPIQRLALSRADLLHATAESEVLDILNAGYKGPIALIPNGVEIPDMFEYGPIQKKKQLLFISRIHPKKGLENLLQAWRSLEERHGEWSLVIAGIGAPDYEMELKNLSISLGLNNIKWIGPAYGVQKAKLYLESSIFILPSFSENFGMVIAEAMSYGLPCVTTKGTPWSILEKLGIGWWEDNSVDSLYHTITRALNQSEADLESMGLLGRAYVKENFSWTTIGNRFHEAYNWLLGNANRPNFIISK